MRIAPIIVLAVASIASTTLATPVPWPSTDGGNDHLYELVIAPDGVRWDQARNAAWTAGGYLASIGSPEENSFLFGLISGTPSAWGDAGADDGLAGPWIGGSQLPSPAGPADGWVWLDGTSFTYAPWASDEPDSGDAGGHYLQFFPQTGFRNPPGGTTGSG